MSLRLTGGKRRSNDGSDRAAATRHQRRRASHAGSWYSENPAELRAQLDGYLADVDPRRVAAPAPARAPAQASRDAALIRHGRSAIAACVTAGAQPTRGAATEPDRLDVPSGMVKALVSPHAGYRYSGPTAAWGFSSIDRAAVRRIFVLGPSHHVPLDHVALPSAGVEAYETPFGNIPLDVPLLNELRATRSFSEFSVRQDEEEHSIEMQLPFVKHVMADQEFTLIPMVVGSTSPSTEAAYGSILAPYFDLPDTLFIISSDFCHWGERFGYTSLLQGPQVSSPSLPPAAFPPDRYPVNAGIELLDRVGMDHITAQDLKSFQRYLGEHKNTICGRHPICVFLEILQRCRVKCDMRFVHYSQSQEMRRDPRPTDTCVAYASAVCCTACRA